MEFQYLTMDLPDPYNQASISAFLRFLLAPLKAHIPHNTLHTIGRLLDDWLGWDVPITQGRCRLYREAPAVNGTATDSSAAGALIGGILGGLLGFLFLLLVLLLASMVVYLAYRRWKDKQITYIREDQESHRNNLTTRYREIDWSELDLMELLGAGAFGKVYKGKWRGATVAVKVCTDFQLAMMTADTIENIRQEVISFVGAVTKGDYFALVTEYCPYGSMYDLFIAKKTDLRKPVTREMLIKMLRDAARGILHLHSEHVIHRDISARNMLVAKDTTVRVTDFGLSRLRQDTEESYATTKSNVGPVKWMAPEAITKRIYSEKSDSWSFGVLVWEMVTQNEPWQNVALLDIAIGVGRKGWTLKIPKNCDPFFKRLMKDCWKQQPEKRPSFQEIEARLSAELGDDSEESTVESDPEEEDKRDDYELRSDHVADFELDEMEAAAAGKAAKKKKKNRKRRRMSRKNDGLDALRGVGGVSHEAGLLEASTTTTTTAAVSPYGDVSSTAMMGGDNLNSLDEASDESGKDFKEHL
ncbi:tyrosine kinase, putative [Acanthamoeba castellanii str. Neff]|uniref:Tyrosine kinase, putative n=1 Tax=Acanthamoeba castellanii (strain ATCC 30010 / Neff) TaxID=1257118 RepID=L8GTK1_ACACF|nr:tyrosine kinase, putative [Acanthamoeba castellanii str. Neff]ELR15933.1 tyrosine kinase, putative [Acanthamoeba castellanii str. Neff]